MARRHIRNATEGYFSFFSNCAKFALFPYTGTFRAIAEDDCGRMDELSILAATAVIGLLTFAVPILPTFLALTCSLAAVAAAIGICSMFVAYPLAVIADIAESPSSRCC